MKIMKTDELKLRIKTFADELIDQYLPAGNIIETLKNTTAKYWLSQNIGKFDSILNMFADVNGEIDTAKLKEFYEPVIFQNDEFRLDVKSLIPANQELLRNMLPDNIILFRREDLYRLLGF